MDVGEQHHYAWDIARVPVGRRVVAWTRAHDRIWPAVAIAATVVALVRIALTISVFTNTVDEPFHIAGAVGLYDMHKLVYGVEPPPLPRLVAGFSLWLAYVRLPPKYRTLT